MPTAIDQHEDRDVLRPPQFGLRMLMIVVSILCLLFAAMSMIGALWSAMLLMFLLLAAAHTFGNAIGTHLRDHAETATAEKLSVAATAAAAAIRKDHKLTCKTRLSRAMITITLCGALAGGTLGGCALAAANWQRIHLGGIVLAIVSSAVLGAFWSFLGSTFWLTIRGAWREALGKSDMPAREAGRAEPFLPSPVAGSEGRPG